MKTLSISIRRSLAFGIVAALLALFGWAPTAIAAPAPEPSAEERAEALYKKGVVLYKAERYRDAVAAFESAYMLTRAPRLLYNLGQARRKIGHTQEAIDAYEEYLRRENNIEPQRRELVEGYLRELRAALPPKPEPPKPAALALEKPAPSESAKTPLYKKWWLWTIVGGVALTAVVVGVTVGTRDTQPQLVNYYDPMF